jgi:uncharacterized protein involved in response to NO
LANLDPGLLLTLGVLGSSVGVLTLIKALWRDGSAAKRAPASRAATEDGERRLPIRH